MAPTFVNLRQMRRVVIFGRGASGKTTLAAELGRVTGLPVMELDKLFWLPGLVAMQRDRWVQVQMKLVAEEQWILDGDLGFCDAVEIRLNSADTVIFLDFPLITCALRAARRSREQVDFWVWLVRYRRISRPVLLNAIAAHAPTAMLYTLRNTQDVKRFIAELQVMER